MKSTKGKCLREILETYYFPRAQRIRSENTRRQYRFAIENFAEALQVERAQDGYLPTARDLTDDKLLVLSVWMQRQLRPDGKPRFTAKTINERVGRLATLWAFLHRKGKVRTSPTLTRIPERQRVPVAWSHDELKKLVAHFRTLTGPLGPIAACSFWTSLHLVMWDTGERIGALRQCELSHVDWTGGWLIVPAENRKGKTQERRYKLREETLAALEAIRFPRRTYIWEWPYHYLYLWYKYRALREKAGFPIDRGSSFHRMRRSVATHYEAAGGNATELLGHSDRRVTKQSYLDERFLTKQHPADKLFPLLPPEH